jgi:hypothetical protein
VLAPDAVALVTVLRSTGGGHFGESLGETESGAFDQRAVAAVGDFNGDGVADLAPGFHARVDMLAGHRGATMTLDASYRIDGDPSAMFSVDVDGSQDVAVDIDEGVVWLRNVTR